MRGGFSLGKPFGVPVRVSAAGVLFAIVFAAVSLADQSRLEGGSSREYVLLAVVGGLLLEAAVLLHEIAHCLVARTLGLRVGGITLVPLGGMTEVENDTESPAREYLVAMAGPATSLVTATTFAAAFLLTRDPNADWLGFDGPHQFLSPLLAWLAWANGILAAFNLLPGLPLDGGRILSAAVWQLTGNRAQGIRVAAYGGFAVAVVGLGWTLDGRSGTGRTGPGFALYGLALALYLGVNARAALRQAEITERTPRLSAATMARRALLAVGTMPLAEALRRATVAGARAVVVVDNDGLPAALMNGGAVDATPEARRPWVPLSSVARPLAAGLVLDSRLQGERVLDAVRATPATEYLVVSPGGDVVGVLATVDIAAALEPRAAVAAAAR
jgi:Zn-dependent protease/CBS domain-containing protein